MGNSLKLSETRSYIYVEDIQLEAINQELTVKRLLKGFDDFEFKKIISTNKIGAGADSKIF